MRPAVSSLTDSSSETDDSWLETQAPSAVNGTRKTSEVRAASPTVAATLPRTARKTPPKTSFIVSGRSGMMPGRKSICGGCQPPGGGGGG